MPLQSTFVKRSRCQCINGGTSANASGNTTIAFLSRNGGRCRVLWQFEHSTVAKAARTPNCQILNVA